MLADRGASGSGSCRTGALRGVGMTTLALLMTTCSGRPGGDETVRPHARSAWSGRGMAVHTARSAVVSSPGRYAPISTVLQS
ncbi:hypothetical protein [Streptomyces sp. DASNCL29]|uniref:hypothetical protein n=1 Tax=Streptomyces sp. DASNCL29 TaxID=2583819 RepID=UPI0014861818|nr:hypothetical protein [Streptomyces sp. DASNCL29]